MAREESGHEGVHRFNCCSTQVESWRLRSLAFGVQIKAKWARELLLTWKN